MAMMASSPLVPSGFLLLLLLPLTTSQLACKSQNMTTKFANCSDLPSLNASLHWTYHAASASLSIAYVAPPPRPDGWVAWALNPTGSGMVGAQALVAFGGAAPVVKTYNISSYGPIAESEIAYAVTDRRAEHSGGVIRLFATLGVPDGGSINQVWQVGASVQGGVPVKHDFSPENLNSKGALVLKDDGAVDAPVTIPRGNHLAGGTRTTKYGGGAFFGVLVLLGVFWAF